MMEHRMTQDMARAARAVMIAGGLTLIVTASGCARKAEKPKGRPPAPVVVAAATQQDVPVQLKAIGTMEASESVTVRTQISGELVKVAFREGQDVQKGTLLFQLDPRVYQAAIRKAEATLARDRVILANARKDYERYAQLVTDGIVTQEQAEGYRTRADSAAADVAADQAALDNAREQLAFCTINAPLSGRLGVLTVDRGTVVKANDSTLVTINKLNPINASFTVPEKELPELKRHLAAGKVLVEAEVPGGGGIKEKGVLSFYDNTVDTATGTIRLKAEFANARRQLWPGQFVNLSITLAVRNNAVVVPSQALQTGQKGQHVLVVSKDATAEIRPVVTGPVAGGMTVVEKGLQSGEKVVIDGQMRVIPGGKVEIRPPDKPGEARPAGPATTERPALQGTVAR
jgi:multidrug efflux system membrane fusion protein